MKTFGEKFIIFFSVFVLLGMVFFSCKKKKENQNFTLTGTYYESCQPGVNRTLGLKYCGYNYTVGVNGDGTFKLNYLGVEGCLAADLYIVNYLPHQAPEYRTIKTVPAGQDYDCGLINIYKNTKYYVRINCLTPKTSADTLTFYNIHIYNPYNSNNPYAFTYKKETGPFTNEIFWHHVDMEQNGTEQDASQTIYYSYKHNSDPSVTIQKQMLKCNTVEDSIIITLP